MADCRNLEEPGKCRALIIESDRQVGNTLRQALKEQQISAHFCKNTDAALEQLQATLFDLILLSTELSPGSSLDMLHRLNDVASGAAILVLTRREVLAEHAAEIETLADDFVTRPFYVEELRIRVRRLLARQTPQRENVLTVGALSLDTTSRTLRIGHSVERLTDREFELLSLLMRQPGHVFTHREIMQRIWEHTSATSENLVKVYVNRLRAKIGDDATSQAIQTIRGVGYRLITKDLENITGEEGAKSVNR